MSSQRAQTDRQQQGPSPDAVIRTAHTRHICDACHRPILPGDRYVKELEPRTPSGGWLRPTLCTVSCS